MRLLSYLNPKRVGRLAILQFRKLPIVARAKFKADRQRYVRQCIQRRGSEVIPAQTQLSASRVNEGSCRADLFRSIRSEKIWSAKSAGGAELRQSLQSQWHEIKKLDHVLGASMSGNNLLVRTDSLVGVVSRTNFKYVLGEFVIAFNLAGSDEPVRWFNQTRRVDAALPRMNAPTVFEDGSCAACELKETLVELIAQFELVPAVELAIQYLQGPDNQLLECFANRWPKVA